MQERLDLKSEAPWVWAALARESLLRGRCDGANLASEASLRRLYKECALSYEPISPGTLAAQIVTPIAHDQFPYQEGVFNELARVHAVLEEDSLGAEWAWEDVIGVPLDRAIRSLTVVQAWAIHNGGQLEDSWLNRPDSEEVFRRIAPREEIETVKRYLTITLEAARLEWPTSESLRGDPLRYRFNPLVATPLIDLGAAGIWCPVPSLVPRAITLSTLYYAAAAMWGPAFTNDLGHRIERYVGRQFHLIAGVDLRGAVKWRERKQQMESVDFIWVDDDAVFLIESKSARMTLKAKLDGSALKQHVSNYLGEARGQIDRTARKIAEGIPEFDWVPNDRPVIGIALTSEPFYLGNAQLPAYASDHVTPTMVMSLTELEHFVTHPRDEVVPGLIKLILGGRGGPLSSFLRDLPTRRNAILDAAFQHYRWIDRSLHAD
jgi:hypothetical protein